MTAVSYLAKASPIDGARRLTAQWTDITPLDEEAPEAVGSDRSEASRWLAESLLRLLQVHNLPPDWDTYGSPPIRPQVVLSAVRVLAEIAPDRPPQPTALPVSGGGVQLEWHVGSRELELEFLPNGSIEFLSVEGDKVHEGPLSLTQGNRLKDMVNWVVNKDTDDVQ